MNWFGYLSKLKNKNVIFAFVLILFMTVVFTVKSNAASDTNTDTDTDKLQEQQFNIVSLTSQELKSDMKAELKQLTSSVTSLYRVASANVVPVVILNTSIIDSKSGLPDYSRITSEQKVQSKPIYLKTDLSSYMFNNRNYIALRVLATALNGTSKQFSISYNQNGELFIASGQPYTLTGYENQYTNGNVMPIPFNDKTYFNKKSANNITVLTVSGNAYFQLRDLGEKLNFQIDYMDKKVLKERGLTAFFDNATSAVLIDTTQPYSNSLDINN
jgi:hypothetical protein